MFIGIFLQTQIGLHGRQTYEAEKKHAQEIEAQTIDNFRIGEMQPERDHNLKCKRKILCG